jgi:hypothetical protein
MEAFTRKKEVDEMKTLAQYHPHIAVSWNGNDWVFNNVAQNYNGGVDFVSSTNNQSFVAMLSEQVIDLAGLAIDDKTIFPVGITTQEAYFPTMSAGAPGDQVWIYDLVTSIPLSQNSFDWGLVYLNGAGFPGGILNFEHVQYQRVRRFTLDLDTATAIPLKVGDEQSGSLAPSASDRLYSYKLVILYNLSSTVIGTSTPTSRILIRANTKEEPEYEYLMRLKRSYDLQNEPDRD